MDGKLTTPAALNGDVRTIPLIDKTLTVEGECADAKATGDRFNAQAAIIEQQGKKIADNAAAIQTLRAENGVQDTTLGEHKALITDNGQRITACENGIGELHRKATEAEDAIDDLKEKVTTGEESFAEVFERLNEQATDINENYNMITQEIKPELAEAKNDIEVLKNKFNNSTIVTALAVDAGITQNRTRYVVSGNVCTVWMDVACGNNLMANSIILGGLPTPAIGGYFPAIDIFAGAIGNMGEALSYPFRLGIDGYTGKGCIMTAHNQLMSGQYVGVIAYIVDETTV